MKIKKENIWKDEKPLLVLKNIRINNSYHIYFRKKIADKLYFNKKSAILFRFSHTPSFSFVCKVYKYQEGYAIHLGRKILEKAKIAVNDIIDLEILQKKDFKEKLKSTGILLDKNKLDLTFFLDKNFIWFERQHYWLTVYHKPRSYITIPKYIELNDDFFWSIGFYIAEGDKKKDFFGVANSDLKLLNKIKKIIEDIFSINPSEWMCENQTNETHNSKSIINNLITKLELDPNKIKSYIKKSPLRSEYGVSRIKITNKTFLRIWMKLIHSEQVCDIMLTNKKWIINFLRGVEAGDGYVSFRRWNVKGCRRLDVGIEMKCPKTINLLYKLFKYLYGKPLTKGSNKAYRVSYQNCRILRELILDNHFLEHEKNRKRLVYGFLNRKTGQSDYKYLMSIKSGHNTLDTIKNNLNYNKSSVHARLFNMIKYSLVKRIKKDGKFNYTLTLRGNYLLNCFSEYQNDQSLFSNIWM